MSDEPFIMLSLKEDKAKKLANALTNKSATKILNYLTQHEGVTESDIAKALKLPMSTVNYNMKALIEAKLVVADEYHYSEKGREVSHYKLAKKYIIIAPEDEKEGFWDKMKKYVPAVALAVGLAGVVRLGQYLKTAYFSSATAVTDGAVAMRMAAAPAAESSVQAMAYDAALVAPQEMTHYFWQSPDWFVIFLLGSLSVLVVATVIESIRVRYLRK